MRHPYNILLQMGMIVIRNVLLTLNVRQDLLADCLALLNLGVNQPVKRVEKWVPVGDRRKGHSRTTTLENTMLPLYRLRINHASVQMKSLHLQ
jgi:hypothetical protein